MQLAIWHSLMMKWKPSRGFNTSPIKLGQRAGMGSIWSGLRHFQDCHPVTFHISTTSSTTRTTTTSTSSTTSSTSWTTTTTTIVFKHYGLLLVGCWRWLCTLISLTCTLTGNSCNSSCFQTWRPPPSWWMVRSYAARWGTKLQVKAVLVRGIINSSSSPSSSIYHHHHHQFITITIIKIKPQPCHGWGTSSTDQHVKTN